MSGKTTHLLFLVLFLAQVGCVFGQCNGGGYRWTIGTFGHDVLHQPVQHANGDLYALGFSNGFPGNTGHDLLLLRFTPNGGTVWGKRYHLSGDDGGMSTVLSTGASGALYMGGTMDGIATSTEDGSLTKLNEDGEVLWSRRVMPLPYYCQVRAIVEAENGDVLIAGSTNSIGVGQADCYVARFTADGTLLWLRSYGWTGQDHLTDIHMLEDGSFVAASTSMGPSGAVRRGFVMFGSGDGEDVSCVLHAAGSFFVYNRMLRNADGSMLLVGQVRLQGQTDYDVLLTLSTSTGSVIWSRAYGGQFNTENGLSAVSDGGDGWFIAAHQGTQRQARILHVANDGGLVAARSVSNTFFATQSDWNRPLLRLLDGNMVLAAAWGGGQDAVLMTMDACGQSECWMEDVPWGVTPLTLQVTAPPLPTTGTTTQATAIMPIANTIAWGAGAMMDYEECAVCELVAELPDMEVCIGSEAQFTGQVSGSVGSEQWSWEFGDGIVTAGIGPIAHVYHEIGEHAVRLVVQDSTGCSAIAEAIVTVVGNPLPLLSDELPFCIGDTAMLVVNTVPGTSVLWSDGTTTDTLEVVLGGVYWVRTQWNGCMTTDTTEVMFIEYPVFDLGPDTLICPGSSLMLSTGLIGAPHIWQNGSTDSTLVVDSPGMVQVSVGGTCATIDSLMIDHIAMPAPWWTDDQVLCSGESVELSVPQGPWQVVWSNGDVANTISIDSAGVYHAAVEHLGCLRSDSVMVVAIAAPFVDLGPDTVSCNGVEVVVVPLVQGAGVWTWSTGADSNSLVVETSGIVWLEIAGVCGSASDTVQVSVVPAIEVDLGADTVYCTTVSTTLYSEYPDAVYQWQDGSSAPLLMVTAPGIYSVLVDVLGCTGTDSVNIMLEYPPAITITADTLLCDPQPLLVHAESGASTIHWSTGEQGGELLVGTPGVYHATVSNACGTAYGSVAISYAEHFEPLGDEKVCLGASAFVSLPRGATMVDWSHGAEGLDVWLPPGQYAYSFLDAYGCQRSADIRIVMDTTAYGQVDVPNVFTPNGDGVNEVLRVVGADHQGFRLTIFNRWGEELYTTTDPLGGWNGHYRGSPVPTGTYVYVLHHRNVCSGGATDHVRHGHVTLLR